MRVWQWLFKQNPSWVGGCRPTLLADQLSPAEWNIRFRTVTVASGIASEVVVASPSSVGDSASKIQSMQSSPTNPTAFADAAEMWNQRFSDESYLFGTEPNVWLREHASRWKAGHRPYRICIRSR